MCMIMLLITYIPVSLSWKSIGTGREKKCYDAVMPAGWTSLPCTCLFLRSLRDMKLAAALMNQFELCRRRAGLLSR